MSETDARWEFWIDRGGTFTDCLARDPSGGLHVAKRLSSDDAPAELIRGVLEDQGAIAPGAPLPPCSVKLGSTVATNALLERRGTRTALVTHVGLGDVLRADAQDVTQTDVRDERVIECGGRVDASGRSLLALDEGALGAQLEAARAAGIEAIAILFMHAYAWPEHEARVEDIARQIGFDHVVASHRIAREMGFLARGETACADAYLTPLLRRHVARLTEALPGSHLRFMQSSGGLTDAERFRGPGALLSGPAGGVVAAARVAGRAGRSRAIGFDMGGTSTDVSLIEGGDVERAFETVVAGIRVRAPMLRIHTVAAGGGSLCRFDGFRLTVGPESAGSRPGPVCYGLEDDAGEPLADELAITDVNLFLGRLQPDRFPFPVAGQRVGERLEALRAELAAAGFDRSAEQIAAGFVEIANASMAQAILEVSVARGVDPRDHALVGFGGAGGQHVCAIARQLGIKTVLLHPYAGLLSAYGIGVADISWDEQRDAGRRPLPEGRAPLPDTVEAMLRELEAKGRETLRAEGARAEAIRCERWLDLRYEGTDATLAVREDAAPGAHFDWPSAFAAEHRARFGYERSDRAIEIVTARVHAIATGQADSAAPAMPAPLAGAHAEPIRHDAVYFDGLGRVPTPILEREVLGAGARLEGPAVILEQTGTVVLDPGFVLRVDAEGVLILEDVGGERARVHGPRADLSVADPVRLEVFGNRFMSMAEQMGAVLRNTAVSTNIKDRLDYSCAVFDAEGGLVANAPHIPVHLGAMGATVEALSARFQDLAPGDVLMSNDPYGGGSHLPDVTVVTPVFAEGAGAGDPPDFFVASRGHHADLGGITPGSMPPDSSSLEEEGVLFAGERLVQAGRFDEAGVRAKLEGARYPARRPDDNVADLIAMVAANRKGEALLHEFVRSEGRAAVLTTMRQLQAASAAKVAREIGALADGRHAFADRLDDGTPIVATLEVAGERMRIDFAGTGAAVSGNLNAPPAVVRAAVIYVLRSLVAERIPLNGGCLLPVEILIPKGSLLDPPPGSAVVGGNVETSQRVVDVLLGALGLVAASQGTMNNVTFGNAHFGYYETIGGGAGAGPGFDGASGVHTHMTNTRITDAEVLESRYPVLLERFAIRAGSGGAGAHRGGDGLVRQYRFLEPVTATLLTERRAVAPWGVGGADSAAAGRNIALRRGRSDATTDPLDGALDEEVMPGRCSLQLDAGEGLRIETPGGGGFGVAAPRHPSHEG